MCIYIRLCTPTSRAQTEQNQISLKHVAEKIFSCQIHNHLHSFISSTLVILREKRSDHAFQGAWLNFLDHVSFPYANSWEKRQAACIASVNDPLCHPRLGCSHLGCYRHPHGPPLNTTWADGKPPLALQQNWRSKEKVQTGLSYYTAVKS